jgi:hypothetical protein
VPALIALFGLLAAAVSAFVLGAPPRSLRGDAAATSFLDAWQRKLEGTYVVDATFTRTVPDGSQLKLGTRIVQRPPSRLVVGLGNVSGRIDDKVIRCPAEPSGTSICFTAPGAPAYEQEVADELDALRGYVSGSKPLYQVLGFRDGCYRLDIALVFPSPPYGTHALFCFDATTGAPSLTVIEWGDVTERTTAAAIRTDVTDADLQIPSDRGPLVTEQGQAVPSTTTAPTVTAPTALPTTSVLAN